MEKFLMLHEARSLRKKSSHDVFIKPAPSKVAKALGLRLPNLFKLMPLTQSLSEGPKVMPLVEKVAKRMGNPLKVRLLPRDSSSELMAK